MQDHGDFYDGTEVVTQGDVAAAPVSMVRARPRTIVDACREIDTLRSINAHLVRQIEELKQREAQALRLADRDGLTGLYNRRKMLELLDRCVLDAAACGDHVGVLFVDLDGFKQINDRHGHAVGDKLLMTVAGRIAARARVGDHVCRFGGDEFVMILPRAADRDAVIGVADSIRRRVALPYTIDGIQLQVTAAVGVALYPEQAGNGESLLRVADESMYREKSQWRAPPLGPGGAAPARRRDDEPEIRRAR